MATRGNRMKRLLLLPLAVSALFLYAATVQNAAPPQYDAPEPAAEVAVEPALDLATLPAFNAEQLNSTPMGILLDPGMPASGVQPMQGRDGSLPKGWKPDPPLDLSGDMPKTEDVRAAIVKATNFVLDKQNENGSWDVVLSGTLLSETADQAVDAIAATSLAGYALRRHIAVNPERIKKAIDAAAQFVIDRVYRGKLPLAVWYANWRYTLGLKFLHAEYMATEDESYRTELRAVCRRLVQGLLRLQLSNSDAPRLERKRRARVSIRMREAAMPSKLGVVLAPPTDEDYRGGALITRVIPGSAADEAGLQAGNRICEAEGLRVENALDYYMQETEWVGGQKVKIGVRREGAKDFDKDITLKQIWPGYLGLKLNPGVGEGPIVEGFLPFSPCKGELEVGDIIYEVGGDEISKIEQFRELERSIEPGDDIRLKVLRGEKKRKKSAKVEAAGSPEGWFGFGIEEEDKGDDNGVVVSVAPPTSPAGLAGLKEGDRVTWIGDTPILGLDHLYDFAGTVAGGKPYIVKWVRDDEEMEAEMIAEPTPQPFDLTWEPDINNRFQVYVSELTKSGEAEKAGMKKGDVIMKINGNDASNLMIFRPLFWKLSAGEEVTFTVMRKNAEVDVTYELPKRTETSGGEEQEEGGWAYYPEMGESPSFSTAAAVLVLIDVQSDMKIKGLSRALRDPLKSAASLLNSLRVEDAQNGGMETYVYRGGSKEHGQPGLDVKGCQGRNSICELALVRLKEFRRSKSDLKRTISQWTMYRGELDAVRRMEYYAPPGKRGSPHNFDRNFNAAYYWMYGHYHTLLAAKEVGGRTYDEINEICTKALMLTKYDDGTWLGHPSFGKLCGTCLGLWILGETEGDWREGYGDPITQEKKDPVTPSK